MSDFSSQERQLVAPLSGGWQGPFTKKPWQFLTTVMIPHLNTLEILQQVIELYRLQTERPYFLIVDTGSPRDVCDQLEALRADDLEVSYIRSGGYLNSSQPVAVAIDLAMSLCASEYLFLTHSDCFPMQRDLLSWYRASTGPNRPVVGYQMSPRSSDPRGEWKTCVSHTATMLHMPTMRRIGARWSIYDWNGGDRSGWVQGWPDTESRFGECLRAAGIKPHFVAGEPNYKRHTDLKIDHVRSYPGSKAVGNATYLAKAQPWMDDAMAAARKRAEHWRAEIEGREIPPEPNRTRHKCISLGNSPLEYLTPEGASCGCEKQAVYACDDERAPEKCTRFQSMPDLGCCATP